MVTRAEIIELMKLRAKAKGAKWLRLDRLIATKQRQLDRQTKKAG